MKSDHHENADNGSRSAAKWCDDDQSLKSDQPTQLLLRNITLFSGTIPLVSIQINFSNAVNFHSATYDQEVLANQKMFTLMF